VSGSLVLSTRGMEEELRCEITRLNRELHFQTLRFSIEQKMLLQVFEREELDRDADASRLLDRHRALYRLHYMKEEDTRKPTKRGLRTGSMDVQTTTLGPVESYPCFFNGSCQAIIRTRELVRNSLPNRNVQPKTKTTPNVLA